MSTHPISNLMFTLALGATLTACGPSSSSPASLFWDVPPPSASTEAVLVASAAYIGDLFAEAEQQLQQRGEAPEVAPSF